MQAARKAQRYFKTHRLFDAARGLENTVVGLFKVDPKEGCEGVCARCCKVVILGRNHDIYDCSDNDAIDSPIFKFASNYIRRRRHDTEANECMWLRGLVPKRLATHYQGPEIYNARVWQSADFDTVLNRS